MEGLKRFKRVITWLLFSSMIVALQLYFILLILKANYNEGNSNPTDLKLDVYQMNVYTQNQAQNQEIIQIYKNYNEDDFKNKYEDPSEYVTMY